MSTSPERHQNRHAVSLDHQLYHGTIPLDSLCYISREKVKTVFVDTPLKMIKTFFKINLRGKIEKNEGKKKYVKKQKFLAKKWANRAPSMVYIL